MSRRSKKKKNPINWTEATIQVLTGLITGIILMILDRLIN